MHIVYFNDIYTINNELKSFNHEVLNKNEISHVYEYFQNNSEKDFFIEEDKNFLIFKIDNFPLFILSFIKDLNQLDVELLKSYIEYLILNESFKLNEYPSFLPFLVPFENENIKDLNNLLLKNNEIYFLNGLPGTGRKTFIRSQLAYNYGISFEMLNNIENQSNPFEIYNHEDFNLFIVPEIAYTTEKDQEYILSEMKNSIYNKKYILSNYDPNVLYSENVISKDIFSICQEYKVLFPSRNHKKSYGKQFLKYMFYAKGINLLQNEENSKWFSGDYGQNGAKNILEGLQKFSNPRPTLIKEFLYKRNIRDLVNDLEIMGIEFAQKLIGNSQNKISKFLGLSRGSLQHKLKKYNYPYNDWEE